MKKTDENLEKYFARLKARGYEKLVSTPAQYDGLYDLKNGLMNDFMNELVKEGNVILEEERAVKAKAIGKPTPSSAAILESALGSISTNPYVRARIQVLKDLSATRRNAIEEMEKTGKIDNTRYQEFVKMVRVLGDRFSEKG